MKTYSNIEMIIQLIMIFFIFFILIKFLVLIIICGLKKIHQTNNNEDVEKLLNPKYYIYDNQDEILHLFQF